MLSPAPLATPPWEGAAHYPSHPYFLVQTDIFIFDSRTHPAHAARMKHRADDDIALIVIVAVLALGTLALLAVNFL